LAAADSLGRYVLISRPTVPPRAGLLIVAAEAVAAAAADSVAEDEAAVETVEETATEAAAACPTDGALETSRARRSHFKCDLSVSDRVVPRAYSDFLPSRVVGL